MIRTLAAALALITAVGPAGPAAARPKRPDAASLEYRRNWPLEVIGAQAAYAAGYSGRGIDIALVDCGVVKAQRDVRRNLSARSVDVITKRSMPFLDRHASWVAGPLAAALNGAGEVGLAYNATVLSIRADFDGGRNGECAFYTSDLARALDYAADQQSRIVLLPLQHSRPLGEAFEAALARVVKTGAVVVIAAGNRARSEPAWPARYATDPRYAGSIVVAGAMGFDGSIVEWTNRAGVVKDYYIAAPGQWIVTDCGRKCAIASGTSFATSYVAGALALIMEAHPDLSGAQAAARVLAASRDAGDPDVDVVYGRGVLDLSRAFPATATASR